MLAHKKILKKKKERNDHKNTIKNDEYFIRFSKIVSFEL